MSHGPGVQQRRILQAVADGDWHYLADLLPRGHTRAEYNALNRAMHQLIRSDQISTNRWLFSSGPRVAIGPAGTLPPRRYEIARPNR